MHDPRIDKLANLLLDHSCRVKKGERVLIEAFDLPEVDLVCALVEGASARGVVPLVSTKNNRVLRSLYRTATEESMNAAAEFEKARMESMQA
jgi:aminopeptidase